MSNFLWGLGAAVVGGAILYFYIKSKIKKGVEDKLDEEYNKKLKDEKKTHDEVEKKWDDVDEDYKEREKNADDGNIDGNDTSNYM